MYCPACGFENLPGADRCDECMQPLMKLDIPQAGQGLQQRIMEDAVSHLNPVPPLALPADVPVAEAIQLMKEHRVGCVLALENNELAGILSERDLHTTGDAGSGGFDSLCLAPDVRRWVSPHTDRKE
jgi:hypothetical protein